MWHGCITSTDNGQTRGLGEAESKRALRRNGLRLDEGVLATVRANTHISSCARLLVDVPAAYPAETPPFVRERAALGGAAIVSDADAAGGWNPPFGDEAGYRSLGLERAGTVFTLAAMRASVSSKYRR